MRRYFPLLKTTLSTALILVLGACGPGGLNGIELLEDGDIHERVKYVVNGQPYSGHPSAGKLTHSGSLCTATLVGKKTVVTAAHCVSVGYSHTFTVGGTAYKSAKVVRHPQYSSYGYSNDIAVIILQDAPNVQGAKIATSKPPVGSEITIVGYGKTSEYKSDAGTKRMAKTNIAEVTSTKIRIPGSTTKAGICNGDSGGPSYATLNGVEVHVGVHSTKSGTCGTGGHDTRVDAFADWITTTTNGDVNKPGGGGGGGGGGTNPPADAEAPKVNITYPMAGATVNKNLTITTKISDNKAVTKVELFVDGKVVSSGSAQNFPVALQPGTHNLRVVASDAASNKGQASVTVVVPGGTTPPDPKPDPKPDPQPQPDPKPTPTPGTFGATCQDPSECLSSMCADDQTLGAQYCTQSCGPTQACPGGSTCFATGAQGICGLDTAPPSDNGLADGELLGSCSVAQGTDRASASWLVLVGLALLGLVVFRRRR
jgi:secreted trypsin-like serine protease